MENPFHADLRPDTEASPRGRRAVPQPYDAVLLASFGGPEGQDDVMPFLRNVTRGRGIPDERLAEVGEHYRALGGRSPINEQNRRLLAALRTELGERGLAVPVHWGNRNWTPTMRRAVEQMHEEGHRRVLAIATSAYSSYSSCRQYREDFGAALVESGLLGRMRIDKVRPYFDHPGFLDPFVDHLAEALASLARAGTPRERVQVLFTTHSIPLAMAAASGPAEEGHEARGGWYLAQHQAACRYVMEHASGEHAPAGVADDAAVPGAAVPWRLVFQSRSGPPQVPWLEPDVNDALREIARAGTADAVVLVPIGFVSDHVEVIWDLDTEAAQTARDEGLSFLRLPTPGTDPRFVAALADLVEERMRADAPRGCATDFGGTADVCGTGCCLSGSSRSSARPTTSALDSAADARTALGDDGVRRALQGYGVGA
ncbi:ferrochelatase [Brachybacterium sp. MASK1Z-5]|uniref:Coproporphyrin III ferrochelatase n=1 Tax=Brachybacterium halotolerans TaxID=2795215 RepID=A0ABS1B8B0_9MICO|nr:ferrochelatase [Brachybacterium halotolerans]